MAGEEEKKEEEKKEEEKKEEEKKEEETKEPAKPVVRRGTGGMAVMQRKAAPKRVAKAKQIITV